jgi:ABC-type phosphate transport system, permease component
VFEEAKPALEEYGLGFLTGAHWQPNRDRYGVLPFLVGTVATAVIALLLAFPRGWPLPF